MIMAYNEFLADRVRHRLNNKGNFRRKEDDGWTHFFVE